MITEKKEHSQLVQDAQQLIHEKYPYLYGATDMAELLQVSSPHLIRCFKKEVGTSPTNYLISHKLKQAKILLLQENLYVDTVANLVGFSCGNYFSKVFKKHLGQTPTEYIQENQHKKKENLLKSEDFPELYL